jgi:hypothetical protein
MHAKLKRIRSFTIMILLYLILGSSGIEQQSPDMMDFEQAREEISAEARRERNKPLVVSAPPGQSEVPLVNTGTGSGGVLTSKMRKFETEAERTKSPDAEPNQKTTKEYNKAESSLEQAEKSWENGGPTPSRNDMMKKYELMLRADPHQMKLLMASIPSPTPSPTLASATIRTQSLRVKPPLEHTAISGYFSLSANNNMQAALAKAFGVGSQPTDDSVAAVSISYPIRVVHHPKKGHPQTKKSEYLVDKAVTDRAKRLVSANENYRKILTLEKQLPSPKDPDS